MIARLDLDLFALLIGAAICLGVSGCHPAPIEPMSFQDCINLANAWHAKTGEKTTQATINRCMCEAHPDEYGPACWVDEELATVREANRWLVNGTEAKVVKASPSEPERVLGDHNEASALPPGTLKAARRKREARAERFEKGNEEPEPERDPCGFPENADAMAFMSAWCIPKSPYGAEFALGK